MLVPLDGIAREVAAMALMNGFWRARKEQFRKAGKRRWGPSRYKTKKDKIKARLETRVNAGRDVRMIDKSPLLLLGALRKQALWPQSNELKEVQSCAYFLYA